MPIVFCRRMQVFRSMRPEQLFLLLAPQRENQWLTMPVWNQHLQRLQSFHFHVPMPTTMRQRYLHITLSRSCGLGLRSEGLSFSVTRGRLQSGPQPSTLNPEPSATSEPCFSVEVELGVRAAFASVITYAGTVLTQTIHISQRHPISRQVRSALCDPGGGIHSGPDTRTPHVKSPSPSPEFSGSNLQALALENSGSNLLALALEKNFKADTIPAFERTRLRGNHSYRRPNWGHPGANLVDRQVDESTFAIFSFSSRG